MFNFLRRDKQYAAAVPRVLTLCSICNTRISRVAGEVRPLCFDCIERMNRVS